LWSYNGCLVGCAMAVFGPSSVAVATTSTLIGAAASPFVAASLKPMCGSMPQWTFAFNIVTLTSLLRTRPLLTPPIEVEPGMAETEFLASLTDGLVSVVPPTPAASASMIDIMVSPLSGISQILLLNRP
jgi:urea transporter